MSTSKKSVPGTGSATGRSPSKQVPVASKSNAPGRTGLEPRGGYGGSKTSANSKGKRGC